MNNKKIIFLLLLASLIILMSLLFSYANGNVIRLDELGLYISIPDEYTTIYNDTSEKDPIFNQLGSSKSTVLSQLKSNHIYLECISKERNEEIVVTMVQSAYNDLNKIGETTLDLFATSLVNQYKNYNINVSKYDIFQHKQTKFIRVYFYKPSNFSYGLQYYTVLNGNAINVTLHSYDGTITSKQENTFKNIVESISFDSLKTIGLEKDEESSSFEYEQRDGNISFEVPHNWVKGELSKERKYFDVVFKSIEDDGLSILFGATDWWDNLSSFDKIGMERSDCDDSKISASEIKSMFDLGSESKVSEKKYNGIHFYLIEAKKSAAVYGLNIEFTLTYAVHFENGWAYIFQFSGASDNKNFIDFERMLNTVVIKNAVVYDEEDSGQNSYDRYDISDDVTILQEEGWVKLILVVIFIAVAVSVIIIIVHDKKNRKKEGDVK